METMHANISTEIKSASEKFEKAFEQGDAASVANLYTENAMVFPAGMNLAKGKKNIQGLWKAAMDMGVKQIKFNTVDLEHYQDIAVESGTYSLVGKNNQEMEQGKFVVVWKREDGQWKLHKDIWNTNQPVKQGV